MIIVENQQEKNDKEEKNTLLLTTSLTPRQGQIAIYVYDPLSNEEIAK